MITTTFETDPIPRERYNTVLICPVIRLVDSKGQVFSVCQGWQSTWAEHHAKMGPLGAPPGRLLPVSSGGSCRSVRGSVGGMAFQ
jgi:hypothetical protein